MTRIIGLGAALLLVVAACSTAPEPGQTVEAGPPTSGTPAATPTSSPEAEVQPTMTTAAASTSTRPPTTTAVAEPSTTSSEPPTEVNPADVEAWWCAAMARAIAAGTAPQDFARNFDDELRHGYTEAPVETVEDAAGQLERLQCEPAFAEAVADALIG